MKNTKSTEKVKLTSKQNFIQFLKFTGLSISAGVIQIASFTLMNEFINWASVFPGMSSWPETLRSDYGPSYLIALILSVIYNFTLNRKFTFKSANNIPIAMLMVFGYYIVFTPLSTLWGDALAVVGWNYYLVLAGTMVINFVTEFLFQRFVVFRNSINTNKLGIAENERIQQKQEQEMLTAETDE